MVNLKAVALRLKAVTNTSKITKAMKMVAASKLRRAQTAMEEAMPFAEANHALMDPFVGFGEGDEEGSNVLLPISSDKGLCGGINSKVVKAVKLRLDEPDRSPIHVRFPPPRRDSPHPPPRAACGSDRLPAGCGS